MLRMILHLKVTSQILLSVHLPQNEYLQCQVGVYLQKKHLNEESCICELIVFKTLTFLSIMSDIWDIRKWKMEECYTSTTIKLPQKKVFNIRNTFRYIDHMIIAISKKISQSHSIGDDFEMLK